MKQPLAKSLVVAVKLPACEATTGEEATRFNGHDKCTSLARYEIGGKKLCGRHAGAEALAILLRGDK